VSHILIVSYAGKGTGHYGPFETEEAASRYGARLADTCRDVDCSCRVVSLTAPQTRYEETKP
jgi:hypothetical protein